jgi:hypothetical protein
LSRDQILVAPVFLAAILPWFLLRVRRFRLPVRILAAVVVAAVVYPLGVGMQWAGANTPGAIGVGGGMGVALLGWSWSSQVTLDISQRKEANMPWLLTPKAPFFTRFGVLFELRYRWRMCFDPQSQAWLEESALFKWNGRPPAAS